MLKRFWVDNFRSLINVEFRPAGINLLLGKNNSGKTNLCAAMRFLAGTSALSIAQAATLADTTPWSLTNAYFEKPSVDFEVECELPSEGTLYRFAYKLSLAVKPPQDGTAGSRSFDVLRETLTVSGGEFQQVDLLRNDRGNVQLLHEGRFLRARSQLSPQEHFVSTTSPADSTMLSRLYDLQTNRLANCFKKYLLFWNYYHLVPTAMRGGKQGTREQVLASDGSNLAAVLYALHSWDASTMATLVGVLRDQLNEPLLDGMSFMQADPETVYAWLKDSSGHRFLLSDASDGTLRYAALLYLILRARALGEMNGAPPLLIVEQPEDGLHVGTLKPLFQAIDPSGKNGQFVFTSHNPYFIDMFDSALEGVHLMTRIEGTHSQLRKVDPSAVREMLSEFSLGEQHYRELLR